VELMRGRIWVESTAGQGSTFHFTARFAVPEAPPPAGHGPDLYGLRALVVDDNDTSRLTLRATLSALGAAVTEASSGERGLAELHRAKADGRPFDLLLLDARMPAMDGFEVVRAIQNNPGLVGFTIMMLTSEERTRDTLRCRELGVSSCLVKPIRQTEVFAAVGAALGLTAAAQASPDPAPERADGADERSRRILLVDDSPENRVLVLSYLKATRCRVDIAENGQVALERFVAGHYDLVLMDVEMPLMDGYTATRAIRQWESERERHPTPVVALTAYARPEDAQRCR
jgi:CheY-like chemotaxis protein